jgi:antitoxin FitA
MKVFWRQYDSKMDASMPKTLSIKDAPDEMVDQLKARAKENHRSLRGEVIAILEDAIRKPRRAPMTLHEVYEQGKRLGLKTSSSTEIIRKMRDERYGG